MSRNFDFSGYKWSPLPQIFRKKKMTSQNHITYSMVWSEILWVFYLLIRYLWQKSRHLRKTWHGFKQICTLEGITVKKLGIIFRGIYSLCIPFFLNQGNASKRHIFTSYLYQFLLYYYWWSFFVKAHSCTQICLVQRLPWFCPFKLPLKLVIPLPHNCFKDNIGVSN